MAAVRVRAARYVREMNNRAVIVAGERAVDIEDAFDRLRISVLPCGCLGLSGTLPNELSKSLERALKTIDAEIAERAEHEALDNAAMDSVRELLLRIGHTPSVDD